MSSPSAPMFEPVSRTPLSLLVARQLRERIVSGKLLVGTQLPTEKELTEQFDVSRSTIREALRILQAQGLLSGGERVSTSRPEVSDEHTVGSAALALENVLRLGQVPLDDLLQLRVLLEGSALRQASLSPDRGRLQEARGVLAALREAEEEGDVGAYHQLDVAFHVALVSAAGNLAYDLVLGVLREAIAGHLRQALSALPDPRAVLHQLTEEHTAILAAVERGHGTKAADRVTDHVLGFYSRHASGHADGVIR